MGPDLVHACHQEHPILPSATSLHVLLGGRHIQKGSTIRCSAAAAVAQCSAAWQSLSRVGSGDQLFPPDEVQVMYACIYVDTAMDITMQYVERHCSERIMAVLQMQGRGLQERLTQ